MNKIINIGESNLKYHIYVSSFNNQERETNMINRFNEVNVAASIYSNVVDDDCVNELISKGIDCKLKRMYGAFYSILQMIKDFSTSKYEYGLFLENDVYLHKNLKQELDYACDKMNQYNLDVLLVGYLLNQIPEHYGCTLIHHDHYQFYQYEENLWGSHGFILTQKQAKYYIDKYTVDYILNTSEIICSDWVFTKQGCRLLMYPPLIVEEGLVETKHEGQVRFHQECKDFLYNTDFTN